MSSRRAILTRTRTEEAKAYRRAHGDRGCKFRSAALRMNPAPWSNTITSVTKDNLLCSEYT